MDLEWFEVKFFSVEKCTKFNKALLRDYDQIVLYFNHNLENLDQYLWAFDKNVQDMDRNLCNFHQNIGDLDQNLRDFDQIGTNK